VTRLGQEIKETLAEIDARYGGPPLRPSTSSPLRPDSTSSLVPSPKGGDEVEGVRPDVVPASSIGPHSWRRKSLVEIAAEPPAPPSIINLLYPGYNHLISGESEALKTWVALVAAVEELRAGQGVLWVDGDDVGAGALFERLTALGATADQVDRLFAYILPDEPLGQEMREDVLDVVRGLSCRLAVFDGFNPLMVLHGLDPNSGTDVERFYALINPIRRLGVAQVLTDNVVKSKDGRDGGWAIGSERKRSKAEVHLGMRRLEPLVRGGTGRSKIDVLKDRPGHLTRPTVGLFVVEAGETYSWRIDHDDSRGDRGEFRPTHLMEKVSRWLERLSDPQSMNQIELAKLGKAEYIRAAIDCLVEEGYASRFKGERRAKLVRLERPFREDAEPDGGAS
jgi:hypothetical protein